MNIVSIRARAKDLTMCDCVCVFVRSFAALGVYICRDFLYIVGMFMFEGGGREPLSAFILYTYTFFVCISI